MKLHGDIDLRRRELRPELMDRPDVDPRELQRALRALARVNWLSRSAVSFWKFIRPLADVPSRRPLRVLDVACGGGDVTVGLALKARRAGLNITLDGCDLSKTAVNLATERAARHSLSCRFFSFDVLSQDWPTDYDVICSALFLHHLPTETAEIVLSHMAQATRRRVLINDLIRSRLGYGLARMGTLLLTGSPIVQYDGPVSVAGAFTPAELRQLADRAGMAGAVIRRVWPERMLMLWDKP